MGLLNRHRVPWWRMTSMRSSMSGAAPRPITHAGMRGEEPAVRLPGPNVWRRAFGSAGWWQGPRRAHPAAATDVDPLDQCAQPAGARRHAAPGRGGRPLSPPAPHPGPAPAADAGRPDAPLPRGADLAPDGGYFLWLGFDHRLDGRAPMPHAIEQGSPSPGALFSSQGQHNHCLPSAAPIPGARRRRRPARLAALIHQQPAPTGASHFARARLRGGSPST